MEAKEKDGQRWQIETVNSMIKGLQGSALRARNYWTQQRAIVLRILTHNVMIIWRAYRGFLQSMSGIFFCSYSKIEHLLTQPRRVSQSFLRWRRLCQPRILQAEGLNFNDKFDILLEIRLRGVAEQGYTMLYGQSRII